LVKKDVADNKSIFLEPAAMKSMVAPDALPQATRKVQTRTYTNFKTGR
jgi:putrescine transport system substrate-binding protein